MKHVLILTILLATGYLGHTYYQERYACRGALEAAENAEISAPAVTEPAVRNDNTPPAQLEQTPKAPVQKRLAPPGVFYMLDRVSRETTHGIRAIVPGDQVKLLARKGETLRVTDGVADYDVQASQVTNDVDLALARAEAAPKRGVAMP